MNCVSNSVAIPHLASLQGRLVNELKISYGSPPAVANAMARTAEEIYRSDANLTMPGSILYSAVHVSEPSGKPLDSCKRSSVKLTLWSDKDLFIKDMKERKKTVFKRIAHEAYEQEGVLTINDCENLMITSKRTLKGYIKELKKENIYLPLRGYVHSTGRGQTHKIEILCFYLDGMSFKDLEFRTYHSIEAIVRYIKMFSRIVVCYVNQNMSIKDIAKVVEVSSDLVEQYLKIYDKYSQEDNERLDIILNPAEFDNYVPALKKKVIL